MLLMGAAAACSPAGSGQTTQSDARTDAQGPAAAGNGDQPVVTLLPSQAGHRPPLDPDADPRTALGRLRAGYFPVWTPEFDGAFPPHACGTAWELDGIAEPAGGIDISLYGDVPIMAALAVMRYEHLVSRALSDPTPVEQLCVAVGSVGPARAAALKSLHAALEAGEPGAMSASHPSEVTLLAVGPSAALAVACFGAPAADAAADARDSDARSVAERSYLGAYLLRVSRGHEDRVADTSYRVFDLDRRESPDCAGWQPWLARWESTIDGWLEEGQNWQHSVQQVSVEAICDTPSAAGETDCPRQWIRS